MRRKEGFGIEKEEKKAAGRRKFFLERKRKTKQGREGDGVEVERLRE